MPGTMTVTAKQNPVTFLGCIIFESVSIMIGDGLATLGARTPAIVLTLFEHSIHSVSYISMA